MEKVTFGIPASPCRSPFGGRRSASASLMDLVQYLNEMPVEERTRTMLWQIEVALIGPDAMDDRVLEDIEGCREYEPLLNVPFSGQQLYCSQEELPSAVAAGVLDKLKWKVTSFSSFSVSLYLRGDSSSFQQTLLLMGLSLLQMLLNIVTCYCCCCCYC